MRAYSIDKNNNQIEPSSGIENNNSHLDKSSNGFHNQMMRVGKAKYPLSLVLPAAAFLISMFVSISVGFAFYQESTSVAIETNKNFLIEKNRQAQFVLSALYKESYDHLKFISQLPTVQNISNELANQDPIEIRHKVKEFEEMAISYLQIRKIYTGFRYIDIAGRKELSVVIKHGDVIEVEEIQNLESFQKIPFERKLVELLDGKVVFSQVKTRPIKASSEIHKFFEVAIPVNSPETQGKIGLIIMEVDFNRFMDIVRGVALKTVDMYLADQDDRLLYRSDFVSSDEKLRIKKERLNNLYPGLRNVEITEQGIVELAENNLSDEMVFGIFREYQNTRFGDTQKFRILIKPSDNKLIEAIDEIEMHSIVVSIGLALVAFITSLFATRKITRPLDKMINSVNELESSNRLANLPVNSLGETGVLARSFHNMQVQNLMKENQIIAEKNKAEKAVHSKSEFFASMSHEIRTPMNGVLGMLGLIMKSDLDKQQKHYATLARSSADSLLVIIDDILDLSKIDAGKIELESLDFNLREQLGIFAESMAYRAQDKGLEMVLDVTEIEQSMVKGDPGRLWQILSNLVGNAIKFTEQGEIVIKAILSECDQNHWLFRCEVKDTGIGIPDDKIEGLFDSYAQVDSSTTRNFGGTGLGLGIVKQLSKLMNGSVYLESQLGKGSEFAFDVKLEKSSLSEVVVPDQDIRGKRILVVDDNSTNLEVISGQLAHWGAISVAANSGKEALKILTSSIKNENNRFDIAILDIGMPEMDGCKLGKLIRQNRDYDHIKLVMMTSMEGSGDIKKFKDIGFSAYFPKPATTNDLFLALQVLVDDGYLLEQLDGMVTKYNIPTMASTHIFSNAHILMVEDNPINREVALGILEDMGVKVDVAENGLEAIEKLKISEDKYGLIIMDCQMPVMDGYQATREIRSLKHPFKNKNIPIVAMTANALKGDRERCLDSGMNDYLTKPVDPHVLEDKLRQWLPKNQQDHHLVNPICETETTENKCNSFEEGKEEVVMEQPDHDVVAEGIPVWDEEAFLKRIRNNKVLASKLIKLMLTDLPKLNQELKGGVESQDFDEVVSVAHRIKGSCGNLSAMRISQMAAAIEKLARGKQIESVINMMEEFDKQIAYLLKLMKEQID